MRSSSCTSRAPWTARPRAEHVCHTGLVLNSPNGSALGRIKPDKSVQLVRGDREAFGLRGRSASSGSRWTCSSTRRSASSRSAAGAGKSALALCAGSRRCWSASRPRRGNRHVVSGRYSRSSPSSRTCPARKPTRWTLGQAVFEHARRSTTQDVIDKVLARDVFEVLPLTRISGPVPARRVRDRGRGAVLRARRPAHRAVPDRLGVSAWCSPTTSRSATTSGWVGTTA